MFLRMTHALLALTIAGLLAAGATAAAPFSATLDAERWKTRPLVVVAPSPSDARFRQQVAALETTRDALSDYAIKLVTLAPPDAAQRRHLRVDDAFAVILIGKDGGEKRRWTAPVDPQVIFAEIDTMPMRRQERAKR